MDEIKNLLIKIRTEHETGAPPDMQPTITAQKDVQDAALAASEAIKSQGDAAQTSVEKMFEASRRELENLEQMTAAWKAAEAAARDSGNLELKPEGGASAYKENLLKPEDVATVDRHAAAKEREAAAIQDAATAAAVEQTNREKAISSILQETEGTEHAAVAHERHGHSLSHLARPMTMMITSAMHLAHSYALLTAANEKDAEAMLKKLAQYEGWIMAATGTLHAIHAMSMAYGILEKQAWLAAAAEAAAMSPLALVAAAIAGIAVAGTAIWAIGDAFDLWQTHARRAAEESRKAGEAIQAAGRAYREFEKARDSAEFESGEKQRDIRTHTDKHSGDNVLGRIAQLHDLAHEQGKIDEDREAAAKRLHDMETRHAQEDTNLANRRKQQWSSETDEYHMERRMFGIQTGKRDFDKDTKVQQREQELRQAEEMKQVGEQAHAVAERDLAIAQRKVAVLAQQKEYAAELVRSQMELVKSAEEELRVARDKEKSRDSHFGRLNETQQVELARINEKVKRGEQLTYQEKGYVDAHGDDENKAWLEEEYRKEGRNKGRAAKTGAMSRPGHAPDQDVNSAESNRGEATRQLGLMRKELTKKENELKEAGVTAMQKVDDVTKITINIINTLTLKIEGVKAVLEQIRDQK